MKILTVTKWELRNTLQSRKFVFIFIFQIAVLMLTIFMFSGFMDMMDEGGAAFTPSLRGFAEINVHDPSGIIKGQLNPDILEIREFKGFPASGSVLLVDRFRGVPLNATLYLDYSDPRRSVISDEVKLAVERASSRIVEDLMGETPRPEVREEAVGESVSMQLVNRVMVAVLLFLPIFLFGNLVIDGIVGEKERKTGEVLIAMPVRHSDIILGKCLSVIIIMSLQIGVWTLILTAAGFRISNIPAAYITVVLSAVPVVGLTSLISVYSKNYREAGIGITLAYIVVAAYLMVPTLAYIAGSQGTLSPMTLTVKLIAGSPVGPGDILPPLASTLALSLLFYGLSVRLFRRDDIVFGPRPGIIELLVKK